MRFLKLALVYILSIFNYSGFNIRGEFLLTAHGAIVRF